MTAVPTAMRPPPSPAPSRNGVAVASHSRPKLGRINTAVPAGPRIILNGVEGFGKTSFGAYAPDAAILMSRGETGYETLLRAGRVPDRDAVELKKWQDVLETVDDLARPSDAHGAVVVDALGGFERLCHEFVCTRDFENNWGEKGFGSFQKGYEVSVAEWLQLLVRLDKVRERGATVIILAHSKIRPFKNPLGNDFDRYIADCHEKTWSLTHKWADCVLFGTFVSVTQEDKKSKRTKGIGGTERMLYTERRDGFDAKNRHGMPPQISLPDNPAEMWPTIWNAINGKTDEPAAEGDGPPEV